MGCSGSKSTPTVETEATNAVNNFANDVNTIKTNAMEKMDTMTSNFKDSVENFANETATKLNDTMSLKSGEYEYPNPGDSEQMLNESMEAQVKEIMDNNEDELRSNIVMPENNQSEPTIEEIKTEGDQVELEENENQNNDADPSNFSDKPPTPMPEVQVDDPENFALGNLMFLNSGDMKTMDSNMFREMNKVLRENGMDISTLPNTKYRTTFKENGTLHPSKGISTSTPYNEQTDSDDEFSNENAKVATTRVKKRQTQTNNNHVVYHEVDNGHGQINRKKVGGGGMFPCVMKYVSGRDDQNLRKKKSAPTTSCLSKTHGKLGAHRK